VFMPTARTCGSRGWAGFDSARGAPAARCGDQARLRGQGNARMVLGTLGLARGAQQEGGWAGQPRIRGQVRLEPGWQSEPWPHEQRWRLGRPLRRPAAPPGSTAPSGVVDPGTASRCSRLRLGSGCLLALSDEAGCATLAPRWAATSSRAGRLILPNGHCRFPREDPLAAQASGLGRWPLQTRRFLAQIPRSTRSAGIVAGQLQGRRPRRVVQAAGHRQGPRSRAAGPAGRLRKARLARFPPEGAGPPRHLGPIGEGMSADRPPRAPTAGLRLIAYQAAPACPDPPPPRSAPA